LTAAETLQAPVWANRLSRVILGRVNTLSIIHLRLSLRCHRAPVMVSDALVEMTTTRRTVTVGRGRDRRRGPRCGDRRGT
jgi:hypothetical protein